MQIDWTHFTPLSGLAGGVLIGAAASACALVLGRAAGVSGVIAGLVPPHRAEAGWRLAFLFGLAIAFPLAARIGVSTEPFFLDGKTSLALAGLCVGFGARLGGGCTSGHGVCGLSRLSLRSLVATCVFMAAAFAVVFAQRHLAN